MFEITIKETKTVKKVVGKEWGTIGTREVPRDESYYNQDKDAPATILNQQIESLDLAAVIKAINKL